MTGASDIIIAGIAFAGVFAGVYAKVVGDKRSAEVAKIAADGARIASDVAAAGALNTANLETEKARIGQTNVLVENLQEEVRRLAEQIGTLKTEIETERSNRFGLQDLYAEEKTRSALLTQELEVTKLKLTESQERQEEQASSMDRQKAECIQALEVLRGQHRLETDQMTLQIARLQRLCLFFKKRLEDLGQVIDDPLGDLGEMAAAPPVKPAPPNGSMVIPLDIKTGH